MAGINHELISDLNAKVFLSRHFSIFRHYQNLFLDKYGKEFTGELIEIGGKRSYAHQRFFPNISAFRCTNISEDADDILDVTQMNLADGSVDGFLCISVLEHVFDFKKAIREMERTLKIGGKLLLVVPFAYPYHDEVDYWRFSQDAYTELLNDGFEIQSFIHLGGLLSTLVDNLNRPRGKLTARYTAHKLLGMLILIFLGRFDRLDGFPLGYGIYAVRCKDH
ncbi:MAG: methyltransferase domain-containing protein [Anaerolineales bacterium]|nr:methyltransferase domain-containing protein [Anaerolineales bacterium]